MRHDELDGTTETAKRRLSVPYVAGRCGRGRSDDYDANRRR